MRMRRAKQQQRQQQRIPGRAGAAAIEAEGIDADSQQQRKQLVRYSSASSFATEMSTVSAKVPLRFVGSGQELDGSSSMAAGGVSPLELLLQVALAGKAGGSSAADVVGSSAAATAGDGECAADVAAAAGCGSSAAVKQEEAVGWMITPEEQQHRAARQRTGRAGEAQRHMLVLLRPCAGPLYCPGCNVNQISTNMNAI